MGVIVGVIAGVGELVTAGLSFLGAELGIDAAVAGGLGAAEAGAATGAGLGLGAGFASDAAIAGGAGLGAGLGAGTGAGLGAAALTAGEASLLGSAGAAAAAPLSAADLALTGAIAGGVPATTGALADAGLATSLGGTGAGAAGAGSAFGGITSDAAGGATIAQGAPLTSTYGPVSTFATGGLAETPSTFASDLVKQSAEFAGQKVANQINPDFGKAVGAAEGLAGAIDTGSSLLGSTGLSADTQALGGSASLGAAPGPGALGAAPPSSVSPLSLDPTSAGAQASSFGGASDASNVATYGGPSAFQTAGADAFGSPPPGGSIFSGAVESAPASAASISPLDTVQASGDAAGLPGQTGVTDNAPWDIPAAPQQPPGVLSQAWNSVKGGVSDVGDFLSSPTGKVLATGVSGLGLLKSLATPAAVPGQAQLNQLASQLGATGASLIGPNAAAATNVANKTQNQADINQSYLTTGSLPPAVQLSLDQATHDATAAIKAQYASRGMPPNSSAEQQDVAALRERARAQGGTIATQLYQQGVNQEQLAASIFQQLTGTGAQLAGAGANALSGVVNTNISQNNQVNNAIANLSSALGGGRTITNTGTQQAQSQTG